MKSLHRIIFGKSLASCLLLVVPMGLAAQTGSGVKESSDDAKGVTEVKSMLPDAPSSLIAMDAVEGQGKDEPIDRRPHPEVKVREMPLSMLRDGAHILISPIYLRKNDLKWLLPLAGATAATLATDQTMMTRVVSSDSAFNQTSINVSDGLRDGFIAVPLAMLGLGTLKHDEHVRETGILASQAMLDAYVVDEIVKLASFRERPLVDGGQGEFYIGSSGYDSSFVSGHSMVAWSSAAVIAGEYRSKWVRLAVYSAAAGVSATRVMGQQHFPTDVLVGSAGGWLIGHYVFRAHHHNPAMAAHD